jgi:hypothetical protein
MKETQINPEKYRDEKDTDYTRSTCSGSMYFTTVRCFGVTECDTEK